MPGHPYRAPEGATCLSEVVACRTVVDGILIDPETDDPVLIGAPFGNVNDPVPMNGQRGIGIIFKASDAAQIQLYAAELGPDGKVKDDYPIQTTAGALVLITFAAAGAVCVFYPDLQAEYVVVKGVNNGTAANTIYLRVF